MQTVLIIGAGVAGLAAAQALSAAGVKVILVEARERVGGRIFTASHRDASIELGAEFVHGRPQEILELARREKIRVLDIEGEDWCVEAGGLARCDEHLQRMQEFFQRLKTFRPPDRSFQQYLEGVAAPPELKRWAISYVEGFHAADAARISVASLAADVRQHTPEDDRTARLQGGYQKLVEALHARLDPQLVTTHLNAPVETVTWKQSRVEISLRGAAHGLSPLRAQQAIITLPLGVLQALAADAGAVSFRPALTEKQDALSKLAMGPAIRVTLLFREALWAKVKAGKRDLSRLGFLFSQQCPFPTWWTAMPSSAPVITGWTAGPCALALSRQTEPEIVNAALAALAQRLSLTTAALRDALAAAFVHNWQADPYSRGAYSYVLSGGEGAQEELARPMANTLFFAGEATSSNGRHGTVDGAMASGTRAARELLAAARAVIPAPLV